MIAKATKRTEPAALTCVGNGSKSASQARHLPVPAQCAHLKRMPEVRCGTEASARAARRV